MGDFSNWTCKIGTTSFSGTTNVITWDLSSTAPVFDRHTIIPAATAGLDTYGRFPRSCPNGSGYSIKLGNETASLSGGVGREASGISYRFTVPASASTYSVFFYYAMVLETPDPEHSPWQQPRFIAKVTDITNNTTLPCVSLDFVVEAEMGGFFPSLINPRVKCRDWTPFTLDLTGMNGRDIEIEFIAAECTQQGHFAYAYVDVNTSCNSPIQGATICQGDNEVTMTAPFGFQSYAWYADASYGTPISTSQTLNLNPAPAVGSVLPVIVEPYPGFGCRDTLFATITVSPKPVSVAGDDGVVCNNQTIQLGTASNPIYTYEWDWQPAGGGALNNSSISNPIASVAGGTSVEFHVKTTDILTGCFSRDTTIITGKEADTTLTITGKNIYCSGDPDPGSLSVNNTLLGVQWYDGTTLIPGATGFTFQPSVSGNYWAEVQQNGCTDSTRIVNFSIGQTPVANAGPDVSVCNNETIQIGVAPVAGVNYAWTPAAQVSDPTLSNPQAWVSDATPVEFIVRATDPLTGCYAEDVTIVTGRVVDTALAINGKMEYCDGDAQAGILSVNPALVTMQWYNDLTPIPGANGATYQPVASGTYWAQLTQFGCTDSSRQVDVTIHPLPVAQFIPLDADTCITAGTMLFTNQSTVSDGSSMSYNWKFSDNTTINTVDANKTFAAPGTYTIELVATTAAGCKDSTTTTMFVLPNGTPDFTWDSICVDRPVLFRNLSNEAGAVSSSYIWSFNNGEPDVVVKDPPLVTYTTSGKVEVTLQITTVGCEAAPQTITKTVQVNKPVPGITYRTITVPEGSTAYLHARPGVGDSYLWTPPVQLTSYNKQYTEFIAVGTDVRYLVNITDPHTCITTDTIQVQILKKPGFYLPTAFTPNGDGLNDILRPYLIGMKGLKSFSVFNRWGDLVFRSAKYGEGWDGKYKGEPQNTGVFVWILEFYDASNKLVTEKGTVTIIR